MTFIDIMDSTDVQKQTVKNYIIALRELMDPMCFDTDSNVMGHANQLISYLTNWAARHETADEIPLQPYILNIYVRHRGYPLDWRCLLDGDVLDDYEDCLRKLKVLVKYFEVPEATEKPYNSTIFCLAHQGLTIYGVNTPHTVHKDVPLYSYLDGDLDGDQWTLTPYRYDTALEPQTVSLYVKNEDGTDVLPEVPLHMELTYMLSKMKAACGIISIVPGWVFEHRSIPVDMGIEDLIQHLVNSIAVPTMYKSYMLKLIVASIRSYYYDEMEYHYHLGRKVVSIAMDRHESITNSRSLLDMTEPFANKGHVNIVRIVLECALMHIYRTTSSRLIKDQLIPGTINAKYTKHNTGLFQYNDNNVTLTRINDAMWASEDPKHNAIIIKALDILDTHMHFHQYESISDRTRHYLDKLYEVLFTPIHPKNVKWGNTQIHAFVINVHQKYDAIKLILEELSLDDNLNYSPSHHPRRTFSHIHTVASAYGHYVLSATDGAPAMAAYDALCAKDDAYCRAKNEWHLPYLQWAADIDVIAAQYTALYIDRVCAMPAMIKDHGMLTPLSVADLTTIISNLGRYQAIGVNQYTYGKRDLNSEAIVTNRRLHAAKAQCDNNTLRNTDGVAFLGIRDALMGLIELLPQPFTHETANSVFEVIDMLIAYGETTEGVDYYNNIDWWYGPVYSTRGTLMEIRKDLADLEIRMDDIISDEKTVQEVLAFMRTEPAESSSILDHDVVSTLVTVAVCMDVYTTWSRAYNHGEDVIDTGVTNAYRTAGQFSNLYALTYRSAFCQQLEYRDIQVVAPLFNALVMRNSRITSDQVDVLTKACDDHFHQKALEDHPHPRGYVFIPTMEQLSNSGINQIMEIVRDLCTGILARMDSAGMIGNLKYPHVNESGNPDGNFYTINFDDYRRFIVDTLVNISMLHIRSLHTSADEHMFNPHLVGDLISRYSFIMFTNEFITNISETHHTGINSMGVFLSDADIIKTVTY